MPLLGRIVIFSNLLCKSRDILLDNIENDTGGVLNKQINRSLKGKLIRMLRVRDINNQLGGISTNIIQIIPEAHPFRGENVIKNGFSISHDSTYHHDCLLLIFRH